MTERSAPPSPSPASPPPAPPPHQGKASKPAKPPRQRRAKQGPVLPAPPSAPPSAPATVRSDAPSGSLSDDTAVRPGLAERVQAKLSSSPDPTAAPAKKPEAARGRGPRRARLRLTRVDPWSIMKTAFLLSIAFGIVTVVAVAMVWQVLGAAGVWESINSAIREIGPETENVDVQDYVGTSRVLGFTMLIAAVDVVLITAMATLTAFLYNMAAALLGGIEVTLAEDN